MLDFQLSYKVDSRTSHRDDCCNDQACEGLTFQTFVDIKEMVLIEKYFWKGTMDGGVKRSSWRVIDKSFVNPFDVK